MLSRKIIIENQYKRLCKEVENNSNKKIMHSLTDYDLVDLITLFKY